VSGTFCEELALRVLCTKGSGHFFTALCLHKLSAPLGEYLAQWTAAYQVQVLPIDLLHALHVGGLPRHHSDPFDRLLIAQAEMEATTLVSADRKSARYSIPLLW